MTVNFHDINLYNITKRRFWWNYEGGYRKYKYFPFSSSSDIIDQFNFTGFSDVCVYPGSNQLSPYKDPTDPATKGIKYVFGGFIQNNQTGTE